MNPLEKEFVPYPEAFELKQLGFDEPCLGGYTIYSDGDIKLSTHHNRLSNIEAPTFSQVIDFLYIYSNKQIDIQIKGSDSYEERIRKIRQGCKDLRHLQNNKSK